MLALERLAVQPHAPDVQRVGQHVVDRVLGERDALVEYALLRRPRLRAPAAAVQFFGRGLDGAALKVEGEHLPDDRRFVLVDHQPTAGGVHVVPENLKAAGPLPLAPGRRHLVPRAVGNHLPLKLRERQQHVQHEPAAGVRRVDRLRDTDEPDPVAVEHFDQAGEVQQGAAEAVHLVADDGINPPVLDVGQQPLERRALHVAAGEAAVVIPVRQAHPALVLAAGDERLARLPLGVKGVERLIEPLVGALAGVDSAADRLRPAVFRPGKRQSRLFLSPNDEAANRSNCTIGFLDVDCGDRLQ